MNIVGAEKQLLSILVKPWALDGLSVFPNGIRLSVTVDTGTLTALGGLVTIVVVGAVAGKSASSNQS